MLAGMPRTGTTSLFYLLSRHPQVFPSHRKELGAFLFRHHRGAAWLAQVFRDQSPQQVGFEATPEYFFSAEALSRMAACDPPPKVVLGIRDPVDFARSLQGEYARRRYGVPDFPEFLRGFSYRRGGATIAFSLGEGAITRMVQAYRQALGDRLLLFDYGVLRREPLRLLRALERFAGIDPWFEEGRFENLFLNTGDRSNWRWLSYLLGRESLISWLERTLPRHVLVRLGRAAYRSSGTRGTVPEQQLAAEPAAEAELASLRREGIALRELVSPGSIVLGSGAPFASVDPHLDPVR